MNKIFGLGLFNLVMVWIVFVLMTVGAKAIVNKYDQTPTGLKQIINAM